MYLPNTLHVNPCMSISCCKQTLSQSLMLLRALIFELRAPVSACGPVGEGYIAVHFLQVEEVGEEGRLDRLCQAMISAFTEAGLVVCKVSQMQTFCSVHFYTAISIAAKLSNLHAEYSCNIHALVTLGWLCSSCVIMAALFLLTLLILHPTGQPAIETACHCHQHPLHAAGQEQHRSRCTKQ